MADTKMQPRRPKKLFSGSEHQHPKNAEAMYGPALIKPCSHWLRSAFGLSLVGIPSASGKDRLAPFEPV
jgi:hypothetical protein